MVHLYYTLNVLVFNQHAAWSPSRTFRDIIREWDTAVFVVKQSQLLVTDIFVMWASHGCYIGTYYEILHVNCVKRVHTATWGAAKLYCLIYLQNPFFLSFI